MSRFVDGFEGVLVPVRTDANGIPVVLSQTPITQVLLHHREWIGVLEGEPERDVWLVLTERGVCELHCLRYPTGDEEPTKGEWRLMRWED